MWNNGPLAVTVTGLRERAGGSTPISIAGTASIDGRPMAGRIGDPSSAFTLAPGEGVEVFIDIHLPEHHKGDGSTYFTSIPVEYRVGPVSKFALVWMGETIAICDRACPYG